MPPSSAASHIGRAFLDQSPVPESTTDDLPESDAITFLTALSAPTHDPSVTIASGDDRVMRHPSASRQQTHKAREGLDGGDEWSDDYVRAVLAFENLQDTLEESETSLESDSLLRLVDGQVAWLDDLDERLNGKSLGSLVTLQKLAAKAQLAFASNEISAPRIERMLATGLAYLNPLLLFEALLHASEMIDADLCRRTERQVDRLRATRASQTDFDDALKSIESAMRKVPSSVLTDRQAKHAMREMKALRDELRRLSANGLANSEEKLSSAPPSAKPAPKALKSALKTTLRTVPNPNTLNSQTSPSPPPDSPSLYNYDGMVVTRSAMELLEQEDAIERRGGGLWERDGVIMTASALSLLQAQEAMQRADSSGQDWGPDTWDGIRGQYIPKWARKLTPADQWPLADEDGKPLKHDDGSKVQDWFDVNLEAVEARNLLKFGMEGVVDYAY